MPRSRVETWVYVALACTAGISEEFLYRGFVFMAFTRMVVNYGPPNIPAAILSSSFFSLGHLYQGRKGIITTFIVAMIFALTRIWSGSLIPEIIAHIGIDLVVGIYAAKLLRSS
jgi:membrane protease YdiL (CAAX protease family)